MDELIYTLEYYNLTKKDVAKAIDMNYQTFVYKTNHHKFTQDEMMAVKHFLNTQKDPVHDNLYLKQFLRDHRIQKKELTTLIGLNPFEVHELFYADLPKKTQEDIIEHIKQQKPYVIDKDKNANQKLKMFLKEKGIKQGQLYKYLNVSKSWFISAFSIERSHYYQDTFIDELKVFLST